MVTGAASGIGRHLVGASVRRGWRVLAADLRTDALAEAAAADGWGEAVERRAFDVRDPAAWEAVVAHAVDVLGGLEVLVNCAGYLQPGWIHEVAADEVDRHLDVNVKGVVHGTRAAAAAMVPAGRGHVVNVASLAGVAPVPGLSLYAASKFAVRGFSLSVVDELAPHGVAVTALCPDAVQTPMLDKQRGREEAALTFSGGRALRVEELAAALFDDVLVRRPREVLLPRWRGWLAKLASAAPGLTAMLLPSLRARGRAAQEERRA
jgi:3-oxoacyl-[acyl-carrier protein] reductase